MDQHPCVSFLVVRDNKILLEKRSLLKESDPGLIAIPGGHMEEGETQAQTLHREMDEELAIKALSSYYLCSLYHKATAELQLIHYYVVNDWQGEIKALEADEVFWSEINTAGIGLASDRIALNEYLRLQPFLEQSE